MRHIGLIFILLILVISYPAQADDATITTCDFNNYSSAMTTLNRGGGTLTIDCSGVITVPVHQVIRHDVTITATGDVIFDGEGRSLHFIVQENASLTLVNLTLKNGYDVAAGGAIINYGTLVTDSVIFEANFAPMSSGAIFNFGDLTVQNSKFLNNRTTFNPEARQLLESGGAITNMPYGNVIISDSTFSGNQANGGGAIVNASRMTIENSTFLDNEAVYGGVILYGSTDGVIIISNTLFSDNIAKYGGVFYAEGGDLILSNSQVSHNRGRSEGGVIFNNNGAIEWVDSRFDNNSAPIGGVINNYLGTINITRSTFFGNSTVNQGGAIYNNDRITVTSSTFYQNHADDRGGAIYNFGQNTNVRILHSTFADNTANVGFGTLYNYGTMTSTYSIFSGGANQCGGLRPIDADETNLASSACADATVVDDLMLGEFDGMLIPLLPDSPALDAYDAPCAVEFDQLDTSRPQGEACDIGAVEISE